MHLMNKYVHFVFEWWATATPIDFGKFALALVVFIWLVSRTK